MSFNDSYVLMLAVPTTGMNVPIVIGDTEAQVIVMAQEGVKAKRPLTHDLLNNLMQEFELTLKRVTVDRFEEGIFYSTLYVSDGFNERKIDSRTSDAVVLSIMQGCPILVSNKVLDETAVEPFALDDNAQNTDDGAETIEELEKQLQQCLETENYEMAAELQARIDELKNE